MSATTILPIDSKLFKTNPKHFTTIIRDFHHNLCQSEFSMEELENVEDWIEGLESNSDGSGENEELPEFYPVYFMMVQNNRTDGDNEENQEPSRVLGGVVLECYPRQKIFLMAYVVVSSKCRGQGVGRVLVEFCKKWAAESFSVENESACFARRDLRDGDVAPVASANASSPSSSWTPLLVIEVYQTSNLANSLEDNNDEGEVAATAHRQQVWSKLGFLPLKDVALVHPGKLKGGKYNIAIQHCCVGGREKLVEVVPVTQLRSWLLLFFRLILEDDREGAGDEQDFEKQAEIHFESEVKFPTAVVEELIAGSEFWC